MFIGQNFVNGEWILVQVMFEFQLVYGSVNIFFEVVVDDVYCVCQVVEDVFGFYSVISWVK